jgi:trypsin
MRLRRLLLAPAVAVALVGLTTTPSHAIVGGAPADEGEYPFMAAITDNSGFQFCGGSVIASLWVITAAHCVEGARADRTKVVTGRTNLGNTSQGQSIQAQQIFVNPNYSGNSYDVALIRLSVATTAPSIAVATAVNDNLEVAGTILRVIGWGDQTNTMGFTATNQLREVDVKVVSDQSCANSYGGFHAPTGVCAADLLKDSCQGDSGGPMFHNATKILVGLVSYGTGCAVPGFPGVYSEVNNTTIRTWITNTAGV